MTKKTEADQWKCGNEFLPYHPDASHVDPLYRHGWNDCYRVAIAHMQAECRGGANHPEATENRMDADFTVVADRCKSDENLQAMPVSEQPAGAAGAKTQGKEKRP